MSPERDAPFTVGESDARIRIVIFHGYTGGANEFAPLAKALALRLGAFVSVPLLPGHGTSVDDLFPLTYDDFIAFAKEHVASVAKPDTKLVLLGHSFGGYLAMECAAEFKARALVLTVVPYWLRFPLFLPGLPWLMRRKKLWDKQIPIQEKIQRIGLFYYTHMPGIALTLLWEGVRRSRRALKHVVCPILTINTTKDPLTYQDSGPAIINRAGNNSKSRSHLVQRQEHGLFYGEGREQVVSEILTFIASVI